MPSDHILVWSQWNLELQIQVHFSNLWGVSSGVCRNLPLFGFRDLGVSWFILPSIPKWIQLLLLVLILYVPGSLVMKEMMLMTSSTSIGSTWSELDFWPWSSTALTLKPGVRWGDSVSYSDHETVHAVTLSISPCFSNYHPTFEYPQQSLLFGLMQWYPLIAVS